MVKISMLCLLLGSGLFCMETESFFTDEMVLDAFRKIYSSIARVKVLLSANIGANFSEDAIDRTCKQMSDLVSEKQAEVLAQKSKMTAVEFELLQERVTAMGILAMAKEKRPSSVFIA